MDEKCDVIISPILEATDSSQLIIHNWYSIEPQTGYIWYDRANVHILYNSSRILISPISGKAYQLGTFWDAGPMCNMGTEQGWSGDNTGNFWGNSIFDLSSFARQKFQTEIRYMTDIITSKEGIYVDDIQFINVKYEGCDQYPNTYIAQNPPGKNYNLQISKSSNNIILSWIPPTSPCSVTSHNIYRGSLPFVGYNHAPIACSINNSTYIDNSAVDNYYYLVVPMNVSSEGSYGTSFNGSTWNEIPQSNYRCNLQNLNPC